MPYNHGVRVLENPTTVAAPVNGTAGLQVVFGTAPVNLAEDPYAAANRPIIANNLAEAAAAVGYVNNYDFKAYTLCQSIDMTFQKVGVAPIVLINVLDPTQHKVAYAEAEFTVTDGQVTVPVFGLLKDKLVVKNSTGENPVTLDPDDDYVVTFDDDGYAVVTLVDPTGITKLKISGEKIDPTLISESDIIGGYNASTGVEKGLEVLRQVFPLLQLTPGLILAPYWSKFPNVAAAIAAKCEEINGVFRCEAIVDLDTASGKARKYTDVGTVKEASAMVSPHLDVEWPCVKVGDKIYHASALKAAVTAYTDAQNDDVPNLSPSNKAAAISGLCLEDGTEVILDETRANVVNSYGVCTFNNFSGWVTWGNNTAAYPGSTDPKDRWFCCRRFFSWWGNSFILTYHQRVDDPNNPRMIEAVVDDENVKGNSLVAQGKCAGAVIEFREEDNTVNDIIGGKQQYYQRLAPYTPAEDIVDVLEFDPALLQAAFEGGE